MTVQSSTDEKVGEEKIKRLLGRKIAFTTPSDYATRLIHLIEQEGAEPLWCPTVVVEFTDHTKQQVFKSIWEENNVGTETLFDQYSAIAFTSRAGITAFAQALEGRGNPLNEKGDTFVVGALGRDAQLVRDLKFCVENPRVKTLVPTIATPKGLVDELGDGHRRKILCPVPLVLGLDEPSVVPDFLMALQAKGWDAVRLNAYVTRWAGSDCAQMLLGMSQIDAIVFTSTAEIQGLLKSLCSFGVDWNMFKGRHPMVVAAHGPVTASGAQRLGVQIDVVSKQFHSFAGDLRWFFKKNQIPRLTKH
ncbi:hypothetical protein SUGI_0433890 [Cryptomeria japonica]|nr:hypothetical protein SUGI_0433890 [Cryptomeria japonica]